jgi:hypothetical protein
LDPLSLHPALPISPPEEAARTYIVKAKNAKKKKKTHQNSSAKDIAELQEE